MSKRYRPKINVYAEPMTYGEFRERQGYGNIYYGDGESLNNLAEDGYIVSEIEGFPMYVSKWMNLEQFKKEYEEE